MSERLTDEELSALTERLSNPECSRCNGRGMSQMEMGGYHDCGYCAGSGRLLVTSDTVLPALTELRERRAADLTSEERASLLHLANHVRCNIQNCADALCQDLQPSIAILDRLIGGKP